MRHLSDGVLRRLCDEPRCASAAQRAHLDTCPRCRERQTRIAAEARGVAALLAAPDARPDPVAALAMLRRRLDEDTRSQRSRVRGLKGFAMLLQKMPSAPYAETIRPRPASYLPSGRNRRFSAPWPARPLGLATALAVFLVAALALTPAGSLARNLLTIFEPEQFAPVPVTIADLRGLPDLQAYGAMRVPSMPAPRTYGGAAAAGAAAAQHVLTPAALPSGVTGALTYQVMARQSASFTFSAARVRAAAARIGAALPPMPAALDGSTLEATAGPFVLTMYGGGQGSLPQLLIAQGPLPRVTSTGASVAQIERYLLAQPGVSSRLAAAIRAIGDPSQTLPIPIPMHLAQATRVSIDGASGLAIGDNTGVGSGVIWEKNGMVYGVAGTLPEDQILAIARSLR